MNEQLSEEEVRVALQSLPQWSGDSQSLRRSVTFTSFEAGIAAVVAVGQAAERANHHPDIDIRWRTVTFTLTTHSVGALTHQDVALARQIDELMP